MGDGSCFAHVFHQERFLKPIDPEVAQHLAFVRHETRIQPIAGLEWQNVVADNALQPGDAIFSRDRQFSSMGEIGHPHARSDRVMFGNGVAIMDRHLPLAGRTEQGSQLLMGGMQGRLFHAGRGWVTSWSRARVRAENSLRETILSMPSSLACRHVSISS